MKKGEIITGIVERVAFPDKGVINTEEGKVKIKGVIKGQKVSAVVTKSRKDKAEARLVSVDERSSVENAEPSCPHFGLCGGCSYRTMSYENQLEYKAGQVKDLLDEAVRGEYVFEPPVASPDRAEYRNKMEFSFGNEYKDGPLVLGLHKKGSFYDIVPVHECEIIHPDIREVLASVQNWAGATGLGFYHKMTKVGVFRHMLVRRSVKTGGLLIDIVTVSLPEESTLMTEFKDMLLALGCADRIDGILHTTTDSVADAIIDEGTELLYGKDFITENLLGLDFKITPFSFFQTNSRGAEVLYGKVREYAACFTEGEHKPVIYDLYSGTGTIGQILSPVAKKVYGIEIVEEAVAAAKQNAELNGLDNCEFIAGDVLKMLGEIPERPDYIVVDPPREGCTPKALERILSYGVESIIYVSCKPTSLARDLEAIQDAGYRVIKACCADMFPFTGGIETVCLVSNRKPCKKAES